MSKRTFKAETLPADVNLVEDARGRQWERKVDDVWYPEGFVVPPELGYVLLAKFGPLTDLTPTPYEAALERLRKNFVGASFSVNFRNASVGGQVQVPLNVYRDMATVVNHTLGEEK